MSNKKDVLYEAYKKAFEDDNTFSGDNQGYGSTDGKTVTQQGHTSCHSFMNNIRRLTSVGTKIKRRQDCLEEGVAFIEWLLSPKSIYHSFIKYLGDDLKVVRDKDNMIIGLYVTNMDVNNKVLTSFFKATRDITEHRSVLPFWFKWAVKKKKNPALAFVLSHFVDESGNKRTTYHSVLDAENQFFAIHRALNLDHKDWDFTRYRASEGVGYGGENKYMWSGKFDLHAIPPKAEALEVPTTFFKKYHGVKAGGYTDETLENFFDNAEEICKGYNE